MTPYRCGPIYYSAVSMCWWALDGYGGGHTGVVH